MTSLWKRTFPALGALLAALWCAPVASGQAADEYGDVMDYDPADVVQTVARVSHLQGTVSFARGDDPDDWQAASLNVPMTWGDRVYTDRRSRLELQVHGGDFIRLGSRTDVVALNLTEDTKQFALKSGIASFQIRRLSEDDVWEVDTPNAAVTFERPGDYRIEVDRNGNTRISVRRGLITVAAGGGEVGLNSGEAMFVEGIDSPRYDVFSISSTDQWDRWVGERAARLSRSQSYQYVSNDIVGVDDLDEYGRWDNIPDYGRCWSPVRIAAGWAPYRQGRWNWQDPWGWTWISAEPWGWAPYHYGRWVTYSSRWYWVPVAPTVRYVAYAPALVAFIGGGPGFTTSVTIGGGGYVGWFPLGPRDPLVPWWSHRAVVNVNVTNVTYINRTYVTVVNQTNFISGRSVTRNIVTDRNVLRQVASAPVVRGAVPVLPTVASTRVAVSSQRAVPRPSAAILARPVVARVAPPPAPPRFEQKLAVIRESRQPVGAVAATRLVTQERGQPRAAAPVRPVVSEPGRVTLAPKSRASSSTERAPAVAPRPVPAASVRGRPVATAQQPVAPTLESGGKSRAARAASTEPAEAPVQRPDAPQPRVPVERERAQPSQTAPGIVRPTPAMEERNRPEAPRERAPVPAERDGRAAPTPRESQSASPGETEKSTRPANTQPDSRERARPTPREGSAPEAQRVRPTPQGSSAREEPSKREGSEMQSQRVVTPPNSREVVRPVNREGRATPSEARPDQRKQSQPRSRLTPTPDKEKDRNPSS